MIFLEFEYPNSKKLYLVVEISQLLNRYDCTYNEADEILSLITDEIKQQRENKEYDTVSDYCNNNKTRCVNNDVIQPLNHVEPYC